MCQRISDAGIETGIASFFSLQDLNFTAMLTVRQTNASTTQPTFQIFTQIKNSDLSSPLAQTIDAADDEQKDTI